MRERSDIPLILGRLRLSKRLTSAKSMRSYAWRYRTAHQFLKASMDGWGKRSKSRTPLKMLNQVFR